MYTKKQVNIEGTIALMILVSLFLFELFEILPYYFEYINYLISGVWIARLMIMDQRSN